MLSWSQWEENAEMAHMTQQMRKDIGLSGKTMLQKKCYHMTYLKH